MASIDTAVLLAAGRGTRMGSLTQHVPKPLLPLQGRPILEHILEGLAGAGIRRATIVTGYLAEAIEGHFGDGSRWDLNLRYRRQAEATGTASALLLARSELGSAPFLLSWGDIIVDPGAYRALVEDFVDRSCAALLALNHVEDPWRGAAVYVDDSLRVERIVEKPPRGTSTTPWNNAGVFVLAPRALDYAARVPPSSRGEYEFPQALAAMVDDGEIVRGHPLSGFWSDLGTPEDLAAAQAAFQPTRRDG